MIKRLYSDQRIEHLLTSFILSACVVGVLVGNAYFVLCIGYPNVLDYFGMFLVCIALVVVIPPSVVLLVFKILGFNVGLQHGKFFTEPNWLLWIYFVAFYTLVIYTFRRLRHRNRYRQAELFLLTIFYIVTFVILGSFVYVSFFYNWLN